jgi:hypothetical protein
MRSDFRAGAESDNSFFDTASRDQAMFSTGFLLTSLESPPVKAWLRRGFAGAFAGLGVQLAQSEW